jgi:peptidoglycan hydrolase-like protein with peptidoglycan-binding domain
MSNALINFKAENPDPGAFPQVSEGATDAGVQSATGIKGLITLITKTLEEQGFINFWNTSLDAIIIEGVKKFQASKGLNQDGIVGPRTYTAMFGNEFKYVSPSYAKKLIPLAPVPIETGKASWVDYTLLALAIGSTVGAVYLIARNK